MKKLLKLYLGNFFCKIYTVILGDDLILQH